MKKYKLTKEDQKLSDADINRYKSFSQLSQTYQRHVHRQRIPLYKNKWAFIALVIIILIILWIMGEI